MSSVRPAWTPAQARGVSLSRKIVDDVRDGLFARRLRAGDFLGTEMEFALRYGVSRIVARDAFRTLEALGIIEIKVGAGGGARIAEGNAELFAEALAVQLELSGVAAAEVLEAQGAIESLAAELAALNATPADLDRLDRLIEAANDSRDDVSAFTALCRDFHLALAEASHNRVLVVQLLSLKHVSWPAQNPTLTPEVADHILDVHRQLVFLIAAGDAAGARELMGDHVSMIRDRRVPEPRSDQPSCC